jgi:ATPase subunit of ABC transporter with duplicated ATPase domains
VLFASHDRAFIEAVADRVVVVKEGKTRTFEGGWKEYMQRTNAENQPQ